MSGCVPRGAYFTPRVICTTAIASSKPDWGDLACVSAWLAAAPSTQCAEWAGHSVVVLHQI
jgi:hypothetical protein